MKSTDIVAGSSTYRVRSSTRDDIPAIVALLADDVLGSQRESAGSDLEHYTEAYDLIASHPNQELVVVEREDEVVGTLDLSVLASLSRRGAVRLQVEAVRVAASERGNGLGTAIFDWIIDHAREQGYDLIQLTSDRSRDGAHTFYERLGFSGSHVGYKLDLRSEG